MWPGLQTLLSSVEPQMMNAGFPKLKSCTRPQPSSNWGGQAIPIKSHQRLPQLWTQVEVE